jgi:hypothetical protein
MSARCPACDAAVTAATLAEGWCECGKRLPPALRERAPFAPQEAARPRNGFLGRSRLLLCLVGLGMIGCGVSGYARSREAEVPPVDVDLADLEAGKPPPQQRIRVGRHVLLYPAVVYNYYTRDDSKNNPRVNDCLCPIVSEDNPWLKRLAEAGEDAPEEVTRPRPGEVTVVLRMRSFDRVSDIPTSVVTRESAVVFVSERSLPVKKERELLANQLPGIDTSRLTVLEERRRPPGAGWSLAQIGGGVLMFVPMLLWMFWPRRAGAVRTGR